MTRPNLGHGCASQRHVRFFVWESLTQNGSCWPCITGQTFFPLSVGCTTCKGCQILAVLQASLAHVCVFLKDLLTGTWGVILRCFDPLYVKLRVGTIYTQFNPQSIPPNSTTKHYDTLVQLGLVSGHLRCFTSKIFRTAQTDF